MMMSFQSQTYFNRVYDNANKNGQDLDYILSLSPGSQRKITCLN